MASQIAKIARRLEVRWKSQMLDGSDSISILGSLPGFQMACCRIGIHEGEMWLFHFFMTAPADAELNSRTWQSSSSNVRQDGKLTSFCKVKILLLATFATDDIVTEADVDIRNLKQPAAPSPIPFAPALWRKALCCRPSTTRACQTNIN